MVERRFGIKSKLLCLFYSSIKLFQVNILGNNATVIR